MAGRKREAAKKVRTVQVGENQYAHVYVIPRSKATPAKRRKKRG